MIVYHGTTVKRARRICVKGFSPLKPSRRVWFAEAEGYALARARAQARRIHDRPIVLSCELDVSRARQHFGKGKVFHKKGIIAIEARVPISVPRSFPRLELVYMAESIQEETTVAEAVWRREALALECLESPKAKRRIRGLRILAELEDPDLFEWCSMYVEDDSIEMRIAALHTMLHSTWIDPETIIPLADSEDKQIRAAAVATLARHASEDEERWFRLGLTDPSSCVRVETARVLSYLDPVKNRSIFSIALHDPNPEVVRRAEKLTRGKGYTTWR